MIREGTLDDYMESLSQLIEQADLDGNGLSQDSTPTGTDT
jgi:hypothetical protein